jgi:cell division control protein 6
LAETEGGSTVTEAHVDDALRQAESNRFQKLVRGQPPHVKYILRALALLTESNDQTEFRTAEVYEGYKRVADHADADPLSYDRVQRLLNEQVFLGITESEHTGGGPGEGSYRIHRLMRNADVVVEALERS